MKILVTGGAGFIGSHLVDKLIERGNEVVIIDDLSSGKEKNINPKAIVYEIDICSERVQDIFAREEPEAVFHLAAQTSVDKSLNNPAHDAKVNISGTVNLLKNSQKHKVGQFIFVSSAAVYGEPSDFPVKESFFLKPISPYGLSKKVAEEYVTFFGNNYSLPYTILRYGNVYGPRQDPTGEAGVIAIFISKMLQDKQVIIYGGGEQIRDFIYVDDVAKASILALDKGRNGVFNIASGIEVSINDLYEILRMKLSADAFPVYDERRKGDIDKMLLDVSRAKEMLGWSAKVGLEGGLDKTIEYFRKV